MMEGLVHRNVPHQEQMNEDEAKKQATTKSDDEEEVEPLPSVPRAWLKTRA